MQLSFRLALPEKRLYSLERFVAGKENGLSIGVTLDFLKKDDQRSLVIIGPAQSGKTHLLKGICQEFRPGAGAAYVSSGRLSTLKPKELKKAVKRLSEKKFVCIDDFGLDEENPNLYDEIFHLFNGLSEKGGKIAFAMRFSPASYNFLPDYLASRLLSGMVVKLKRPGEHSRTKILHKLAFDMQLSLTPRAAKYILERSPRSVSGLKNLLEGINENLRPTDKRIGLQLIRRVIKSKLQ